MASVGEQSLEARIAKLEETKKRLESEQEALAQERIAFEERKEQIEAQNTALREAAALANVSIDDENVTAEDETLPGFDLRTHIRNKTGRVNKLNLYNLWVVNKVKIFERPPGSQKFYYENNEPAEAPEGYKPPGFKAPTVAVKKRA